MQADEAKVGEQAVPPPSPRANGSLTLHPSGNELLLFGGEHFDGKKNTFYNELYRYSIKRNDWRLVTSNRAPPPRSSHQAPDPAPSPRPHSSPRRTGTGMAARLWPEHPTSTRVRRCGGLATHRPSLSPRPGGGRADGRRLALCLWWRVLERKPEPVLPLPRPLVPRPRHLRLGAGAGEERPLGPLGAPHGPLPRPAARVRRPSKPDTS